MVEPNSGKQAGDADSPRHPSVFRKNQTPREAPAAQLVDRGIERKDIRPPVGIANRSSALNQPHCVSEVDIKEELEKPRSMLR